MRTPFPLPVLLSIVLAWAPIAGADVNDDDVGCAEVIDDPLRDVDDTLPTEGTIRALFIFARFKDDNRHDWDNDWPIDPSATTRDDLPPWAASLLENTGGVGVPQIEGSLAHYFWLMSRGKLRVDVVPYEEVIVLEKTIQQYMAVGGSSTAAPDSAAHDAILEVAATGFDFAPFASGTPPRLEFVCVVFRGALHIMDCNSVCRLSSFTGHAGAGGYDVLNNGQTYTCKTSRTMWVTSQGSRVCHLDYPSPPSAGAVECGVGNCEADPCTGYAPCGGGGISAVTCPVQCTSLEAYRQAIVHEMGHSLLLHAHDTVGGTISSEHVYSPGAWCVMHSNGRGNVMHGYERIDLGWAEPVVINPGEVTTIRVHDSVLHNAGSWSVGSADSIYYRINTGVPGEYFLLENRRASTVYAEDWEGSSTYRGVGQPGSGLLISHVNPNGTLGVRWNSGGSCPPKALINIESAYGFVGEDFEPDPENGRSLVTGAIGMRNVARAEDAFGPGRNNTFAPYTCPNSNLYGTGTAQTVSSGLAVVNIRMEPDSTLVADVRWNQPAAATSGNVTWDGQVLLSDDFTVSEGDTIIVRQGSKVMARHVPLHAGSLQEADPLRVEFAVAEGGVRHDEFLRGLHPRYAVPVGSKARG